MHSFTPVHRYINREMCAYIVIVFHVYYYSLLLAIILNKLALSF